MSGVRAGFDEAPLFPLFLRLEGRRVLLVGAGTVASAKLESLLAAKAQVTIVAPQIRPELERDGVTIVRRTFEPADVDGAWLVVAAAPPAVNREVVAAAEERRIFVNSAADPRGGSAYAGGVLRRPGLTVAVSTEGSAPALAGLLREGLEAIIPDDVERWARTARSLRERWLEEERPMGERRGQLLDALNQLYATAGIPSAPGSGGPANDMRQATALGRSIEDGSFAIVDQEVGAHPFPPDEWQVVRRVIHATADFEFKTLMRFHPDAVRAGVAALRAGCPILVDVKMITAGLNEERLRAYGCVTHSFISDDDVITAAKANNSTRAIEAMRKAHRLNLIDGAIVAVGNAPTALLEVARLVREEAARPALVIGVPVGFVSAVESKQAILDLPTPFIVAEGRKGGSTIAVAIIHALLLLSAEERA